MKKIVAFLLMTTVCICEGLAQIQQMTFGIRGAIGSSYLAFSDEDKENLGKTLAETMRKNTGSQTGYYIDDDSVFAGGFFLFCNYAFPKNQNFGIQTELGLLFNNGAELICKTRSSKFYLKENINLSYNSLELPVLLTYTFNKDKFVEFIPHAGLYLSFPLGKCSGTIDATGSDGSYDYSGKVSIEEEYKIDNSCMIGFATGCDVAMNFTKISALILNLRYMIDFNELQIEEDEIGRRSVFLFSAGYRYTVR